VSQSLSIVPHTHTDRTQRQLILRGDALREKMESVIRGRFQHRNADGTIFTPRVSGAFLWPGVAFVVTIDSERLWHFSVARMCNQDTTDLMALGVGRPVRVIRKIPAGALGNATERETLAYAVLLNDCLALASKADAPALVAPKSILPKMADVNFIANKPAGDYMLGLGVDESGEVWKSICDMGHVMVCGSTGSGKSACIRSLLYQLARMQQPVELYLTDMEDMTFPWAEPWPITKAPIAKGVEAATEITGKLIAEMERRAELYRGTGKYPENWQEYREVSGKSLPWIVAIFEEVSALADEAGHGSRLMHHMRQIAMRARKYGITLIFVGQDFKADLFNTAVTNQFKTRLVFRCQRREQSLNSLGEAGAEMLVQPGRALAKFDGAGGAILEVQGFWVPKSVVLGETATSDANVGNWAQQSPQLSADERRLVSWALTHPDEFAGGLQQNLLEAAFDVASPQDGGKRITARQIRAARERFISSELVAQRPGCGTKYFISERLSEQGIAR